MSERTDRLDSPLPKFVFLDRSLRLPLQDEREISRDDNLRKSDVQVDIYLKLLLINRILLFSYSLQKFN